MRINEGEAGDSEIGDECPLAGSDPPPLYLRDLPERCLHISQVSGQQ